MFRLSRAGACITGIRRVLTSGCCVLHVACGVLMEVVAEKGFQADLSMVNSLCSLRTAARL
jgi:hypothetical protein